MRARAAAVILVPTLLLLGLAAAGCGQATPEQAVYKCLGAVQSQDRNAMRSCVNPEALRKAEEGSGEIARQWDELCRRYFVEPVNWRLVFDGVRLESTYLDSDRALAVIRILNDMARQFDTAIVVVTHDEKIIPTFKRIYHIRDGVTYEEAGQGRAP